MRQPPAALPVLCPPAANPATFHRVHSREAATDSTTLDIETGSVTGVLLDRKAGLRNPAGKALELFLPGSFSNEKARN